MTNAPISKILRVVAAAFGLIAGRAPAQCLDWATGFEPPPVGVGLNGPVYAMAIFDEDGPGGNPPSLIVGGHFTSAGGAAVNNIARWNGTAWSDVGGGVTGGSAWILSLHVAKPSAGAAPSLYVGGNFTTAGGTPANNIARWNGATWSALGAGTAGNGGWVRSICAYTASGSGTQIYAGGDFTSAGGIPLNFIARWNGAAWSALGSTVGTSGGVFAMTVYGGNLVVGGAFPTVGTPTSVPPSDVACNYVAKWNGTAWSAFGSGVNSTVNALFVDGGSLYLGGNFTTASGTPANRIARWNGGGFSALGTGTSGRVLSLAAFDDECGHSIYAGGEFLTAGGITTNFIARWVNNPATGSGAWKTCGLGSISWVRALKPYFFLNNSALYAGGEFGAAGGHPSAFIAKYIPQDQDGDGIYDCWETDVALGGGIDINCDGVIDLDLFAKGARKDHKDIFVELDFMAGFAVLPGPINRVVDAFDDAPVANPDGISGIKLHVDGDEFGIPAATWAAALYQWPPAFDTFKSDHFGTIAERGDANRANILAAKKLVYRYCAFVDNSQPDNTSGLAEIGGNDFMISLGRWTPVGGTDDVVSGTFMHELGHTLGLHHGGNQVDPDPLKDYRYNYKPNYYSIMNYTWQTSDNWMGPGSWPLDPGNLGYSTGARHTLDEAHLVEANGIGGDPFAVVPCGPPVAQTEGEGGPVNFDRDPGGTIDAGTVAADVNHLFPLVVTPTGTTGDPASPGDTLTDHDDWHGLKYNFRDSGDYADGEHQDITPTEMTWEIHQMLNGIAVAHCPGDANGDRIVNIDDLVTVIVNWGSPGPTGDLTGNGLVDIDDLVAVITHWGACP
jgi:hypothetical protein